MTRASLRDASFFRNPSTHGPVRYHIVRDEVHKGEGACGAPVQYQGPGDVLDPQRDAEGVPAALRCMKPGCRTRWPAGVSGTGDQTFSQKTPTE